VRLSLKIKMEGIMATLKEVYEPLKQKQKDGEDIEMFGESYLKMIEVESNTKEVHVSFVENKEND
jgi:hypothetical protein